MAGWKVGAKQKPIPTSAMQASTAAGDDGHVHVAAQRVDQVVAADRQPVAVAGDHEHLQVGAGRGDARRDGWRTPVDRVEAERVHVVREAAGAADAGHEHQVLTGDTEVGHQALHVRRRCPSTVTMRVDR
jgi:hypothetical protein